MVKNNLKEPCRSTKSMLFSILSPAFLIVLNIFLFTPFTIYQSNISEFAVPLMSIIKFLFVPCIILIFIFIAVGLLLPKKLHTRFISLLFCLGILIWLQGNILVWKYGLFDGQGIDWTKNVWRGWLDGSLWIMLLIIVFLFHNQIYKISIFASIVLVSLQLLYLGFISLQKPEIWKGKEIISRHIPPPKEIFQFSSNKNVIHVILDALQSDIFQEIIDEETNHYYTALEGFTFFKETTGSFPTTKMSIPAILSGQNYKNDIPMPKFINNLYKGSVITNVLYDSGYEVDIIANSKAGRYSNYYRIPTPYGVTNQQYEQANSALMLDLVLFRSVPHFLKKSIYNNQTWLIQRIFFTQLSALSHKNYGAIFRYFAHETFLDDLIDNMTVKRNKPVYKFIHLMITHNPIIVDADCKYAGKVLRFTRQNTKILYKCNIDHLIEFLNKLKLMGIYDSSLIIVNADHGAGQMVKIRNMDNQFNVNLIGNKENFKKIVGSALPLMVIKPPYSEGPLKISSVQVMLTDIPDTISSILNLNEKFNGRSMFEISDDEVRERRFYYYKWRHKNWQDDYFNLLTEFIIKGSVFDSASWSLGLTYHAPGISYQTQRIDFGTEQASRFKRFGWSGNEISSKYGYTFNWALGSSASIFLSLRNNKPLLLTANIRSLPFKKPQRITIKLDGHEIGYWELSAPWNFAKHSIIIKPDKERASTSTVEFVFSQFRKPDGGNRPLAVAFESIILSET